MKIKERFWKKFPHPNTKYLKIRSLRATNSSQLVPNYILNIIKLFICLPCPRTKCFFLHLVVGKLKVKLWPTLACGWVHRIVAFFKAKQKNFIVGKQREIKIRNPKKTTEKCFKFTLKERRKKVSKFVFTSNGIFVWHSQWRGQWRRENFISGCSMLWNRNFASNREGVFKIEFDRNLIERKDCCQKSIHSEQFLNFLNVHDLRSHRIGD